MAIKPFPEALRAPISNLEEGKAWIRALDAADLMFHFEDSPEEIVGSDNLPIFTKANMKVVRQRVAELYALEWGPRPGLGRHYCPIGYSMTLAPFMEINQAEGYEPRVVEEGRVDHFVILDCEHSPDYEYGAPGRYCVMDEGEDGGHVGDYDTPEEAMAMAAWLVDHPNAFLNLHHPLLREQFPDFDHEVPAELLEHGFGDTSWGNDTCPSFECDVFVLYVDYLDAAKREFPSGPLYSMTCEGNPMLSTDSWDDVRAFIVDGKRDFPEYVEPLWRLGAHLEYSNGQEAQVVWVAPEPTVVEGGVNGHWAVLHTNAGFEPAYRDESVRDEGGWSLGEEDLDAFGMLIDAVTWIAANRFGIAVIDTLTTIFASFVEEHGLPEGDATELLMGATLTEYQRAWLTSFVEDWEAAAAADPEFYEKQTVVEA